MRNMKRLSRMICQGDALKDVYAYEQSAADIVDSVKSSGQPECSEVNPFSIIRLRWPLSSKTKTLN